MKLLHKNQLTDGAQEEVRKNLILAVLEYIHYYVF